MAQMLEVDLKADKKIDDSNRSAGFGPAAASEISYCLQL